WPLDHAAAGRADTGPCVCAGRLPRRPGVAGRSSPRVVRPMADSLAARPVVRVSSAEWPTCPRRLSPHVFVAGGGGAAARPGRGGGGGGARGRGAGAGG